MTCAGCEDCAFVDDITINPFDPAPFEIHVTVDGTDFKKFSKVLDGTGVKPLYLIDFHKNGECHESMMTSHKMKSTTYAPVFKEMNRIERLLQEHGFEILRKKIETMPFVFTELRRYSDQYFESHIGIISDNIPAIMQACEGLNLHFSKSKFKDNIVMATFRRDDCNMEQFRNDVLHIRETLESMEIMLESRMIMEYTYFDSNRAYDNIWLSS